MARLNPLHFIPALIAAASHAGEITVATRAFSVEHTLTAMALPSKEGMLLRLDAESWTEFRVLEIAAHGTKVAKGDLLIRFDSQKIDEKLEDARRTLAVSTLALQQAELSAKNLRETAPHRLEAVRRAAEIAKEERSYFTGVRRKAAEDSAAQALKRSQQILANQREELKQLNKMYEADDITEDTEEIILVRQQDAVAAAEFAARMEAMDHQRTLEVTLPREAKTLADHERDTALRQATAEIEIPRAIEQNSLEVEALKTSRQRSAEALATLEADRGKFEITAPSEGWFYHGAMENGRWTTGESTKNLTPNGRPAGNAAFATFIPGNTEFQLVAFVDEATARALTSGLSGIAILAGREDLEIPVKLLHLAEVPGPDGTYRADVQAHWPKEARATAGTTAGVQFISYQNPATITIPTKALRLTPSGWTVEVKLADGKTEHRPVKRGRVSKENTEILSGLEVGQVIIHP